MDAPPFKTGNWKTETERGRNSSSNQKRKKFCTHKKTKKYLVVKDTILIVLSIIF